MAEKIKTVEMDMDIKALIFKAAQSKGNIQFTKTIKESKESSSAFLY